MVIQLVRVAKVTGSTVVLGIAIGSTSDFIRRVAEMAAAVKHLEVSLSLRIPVVENLLVNHVRQIVAVHT